MLEKTKGIVLHTLRYNDTSLIVDIFTESHGAQGFMVRTPRGHKSVLRNVLLTPLSLLELDFDYRESQHLQRLSDVRVAVPYASLPYHPVKETIALFLGEFLYYALRNESENPALFAFLQNSMLWLDGCQQGYANFPATLLIRLSRFLGFWPSVEEAQGVLRRGEEPLVPLMLRMNYGTMHLFRFTPVQRARLMEVLNDYYRLHIPGFPELRSMAILREVLS